MFHWLILGHDFKHTICFLTTSVLAFCSCNTCLTLFSCSCILSHNLVFLISVIIFTVGILIPMVRTPFPNRGEYVTGSLNSVNCNGLKSDVIFDVSFEVIQLLLLSVLFVASWSTG